MKNKTNRTNKRSAGEAKFVKCESCSERGDKKCVISDPRRSSLSCLEMLDRAPSAVFDGLMNSRPACQDKAPCLAEHGGAGQIPIRKSLVSLAQSEPDGQALNL